MVIVGVVAPQPVCADSWSPPTTETTLSSNGRYRFTVEPAPIDSALEYFSEEVRALEAGEEVERPAPIGMLERRVSQSSWEPVWAGRLVNSIAPVSVLVSDDGSYVVTFDNWHSVGHGDNVIVIYGAEGTLVRSMALTDLVTPKYKDALPHTVSSLRWKSEAKIDPQGSQLVIDVLVPGQEAHTDQSETIEFQIALSDGSISMPPEDEWKTALCAANIVNEMRERAELERKAYLRRPLTAPATCEMRDWHQYLREAHARLASPSEFTSTKVLFARGHPRYEESVGWLREAMDDAWGYPRSESFASPCDADGLVDAVASIVRNVPPGSWPDATFYISVPESKLQTISDLIRPTGAKIVWLDPRSAIPQRPDRMPDR